MAFVAQDDKQNVNGNQNPQAQGSGSSGGVFAGSGGGGDFSTSPVSTAGVGAGGGGGWTNIQSYLTANQGNTGTADALKSTAGSTFDQEQKNLDQTSQAAKSQADSEVQKTNIGQDQASQMISEMGSRYNYNGNQDDTYNGDLSRFQTGINSTYGGPTSYTYGMGADAQRYGTGMGSDQGFQSIMSDLYNKAAGGLMNQGQLTLQQNLDQNNPAVNQTRQDLLNQYSGLQSNVQNTVSSTDAAVKAAQGQFAQNQQGIRDYLMGTQNTDQQGIQKAVSDWNAAEQAIASGQNKVFLGSNPQGNEARNYNMVVKDRFGRDQTLSTSKNLNDSDYYDYAPGGVADMTNIGGEDTNRGQLNALADILGGSKINQAAPVSHGGYNFNQSKYDQAWSDAQKAAMAQLSQQWMNMQADTQPTTPFSNSPSPKVYGAGPFSSGL